MYGVSPVHIIPYFRPCLHTLNNVHDSWARVLCGEGLALMKFTESRHQVMRLISWAAFIEPVDLGVIVVIMRATLESSLGNCNVLQCDKVCEYFVYMAIIAIVLCEACY